MKVLIIQKKMIGDVLTTSILFEALKKEFPKAQLHYLVMKHTTPVIKNNPFIDRVFIIDNDKDSSITKILKAEGYDIIVDSYSKVATGLLSLKIGAKKRIGYKKWYSWLTYNLAYSPIPKSKNGVALAIENRFQLISSFAEQIDYSITPKIYITEEEKQAVRKKMEASDLDFNKPIFMLNVLGSSEDKTYPLHYFAELTDTIVKHTPHAQLLFNYIPSQLESANAIYDKCKPETQQQIFFDLYGNSLREFIILTSFCTALIGNEGGAVNMAKAVNVPTFAIFSPWVRTETWAIEKEHTTNKAIHLKQFFPELFTDYKRKAFHKRQAELYKKFTPDLISPKLNSFLDNLK
ncbi:MULTISPECIES: glycosyltransferase family 9 protein [Croceibacter]|jgi:heptosyltransferase-2|uniref:glycosyltransferase family 9 protein n=1 Tax=Croceibacter TaxID=216431 RepID=UPI000C4000C2|nr:MULTISPECIES: glycosyltransferase family 9 protein [Croceibacter]MBG26820.1 glycosyltransferase [Croceibacter sp.]HAT70202.1 glycosyltransferase [Flavobacteriaceae bacterium]|tara:strand:+ start:3753 stop:4799 length:1047 start_codon:yes stop_codon:yes gene_type:complete